jgi:hypothetical protein
MIENPLRHTSSLLCVGLPVQHDGRRPKRILIKVIGE